MFHYIPFSRGQDKIASICYARERMKLLEYEAKTILKNAGVPVPASQLVHAAGDAVSLPAVLKSQVPTGGRGKAGGVKIVTTQQEYEAAAKTIFTLPIKGFTPTVLLAEELLGIEREHYLSLLIDRNTASIRLVAHKDGGVEVEENDPTGFLNVTITTETLDAVAAQAAQQLGYEAAELTPLIRALFNAFVKSDAMLLEINPLVRLKDGTFACGDSKMELDDAAAFRHPEWDFEDKPAEANFVTLNQAGTVATIANGAGLAMATVDAVAARGLVPANFLDIGGGANTESVLRAFRQIMEFPSVQAIVINIFAGITRCDEVARAIIAAKQQLPGLPPLFIRLAGTNFEEAVALLSDEDIPTLASLDDCLTAAKEAIHA